MKNHFTLTLTTPPSESIRALEIAAAQRPNWRLLRGGSDDQPRVVIEKQVRYNLLRGWSMDAVYQVIGGFQKSPSGAHTLEYVVSGQPWIAMFHAAGFIGALLPIILLIGSLVFAPTAVNQWVGILLIGVLIVSMVVYVAFAYRSYQGHLQELSRFMEEYAQGIRIRT